MMVLPLSLLRYRNRRVCWMLAYQQRGAVSLGADGDEMQRHDNLDVLA